MDIPDENKQTTATHPGELADAVDDADGRERNVLGGETEDLGHGADGREHRVVVVQRLAHAHEHHVADRRHAVRERELLEDLAAAQVGDDAHGARGAERAPHLAADLRRHAQRVAALVAHDHGLDRVPVLQAQQHLDRAVARVLLRRERRREDGKVLTQQLA